MNATKRHPGLTRHWPVDKEARAELDRRAAKTFRDMPPATQAKYRELAALFPDDQIFAVGSRVNGEWVDGATPRIMLLRSRVGKTKKTDSDFDFVVNRDAKIVGALPAWADRIDDTFSVGRRVAIQRK